MCGTPGVLAMGVFVIWRAAGVSGLFLPVTFDAVDLRRAINRRCTQRDADASGPERHVPSGQGEALVCEWAMIPLAPERGVHNLRVKIGHRSQGVPHVLESESQIRE